MEFMSPLKVTRNSQHQPAVSVCRGWGGGLGPPGMFVCVRGAMCTEGFNIKPKLKISKDENM